MENKLQAFSQIWTNLTSGQRVIFTFFAAAVVVAMVGVTLLASRPDYTVLFSNLKPEDAASIAEKLRDSKTPYRIAANGTAVEVPSKDVYDIRLNLAGQGLPRGGNIGFEVFDKGSLGVTDFSQKMNYLRALQGELERTITSVDQVADARVHIVIPEDTIYSDKQAQATASVLLNLKGTGRLEQENVASIVNIVSAAVEGLKPERVTVADTRGNLLADGAGEDKLGLKMSASQLDVKRSIEHSIQQDVGSMLDRVVGPGKAVVRVSARLSFDTKETTNELYQPAAGANQGIITSQEKISETYGSAARGTVGAGGVPGTGSNMNPPVPRTTSGTSGASGGYSRIQDTTQYQVSKKLEKVAEAPGRVETLNVAVMVDNEVGPAKLALLKDAVKAASGANRPTDNVVVEGVDFPKEKAMEKPSLTASLGKFTDIGRNALAIVMLIVFAFFLKGTLAKQSITINGGQMALSRNSALGIQEQGTDGAQQSPSAPALRKSSTNMDVPVASAQELAKQSPQEIATVVRSWLSEDKKVA